MRYSVFINCTNVYVDTKEEEEEEEEEKKKKEQVELYSSTHLNGTIDLHRIITLRHSNCCC